PSWPRLLQGNGARLLASGATMRPSARSSEPLLGDGTGGGVSPGDPVSLILARPDVHRVIVRAVLRAVQTINCVHHLPAQHLLVAHEIRRAVLGARSVRWLRLRDPIHHRSVQTAKLLVVGRS